MNYNTIVMPLPTIDMNKILKYQNVPQAHLTKLTTNSINTITRISNLTKFKCASNAKVPQKGLSWTDPQHQTRTKPKGNYGVVCGSANNLIVLDVDVKDDGLAELQDYIKNHGNINTYTVRTPSGGYHYYFNYKGASEADNERIARWLRNSTKYRAKGLDIRTQGGYVVGPGSRVGGKEYEVSKNTDIGDMPSALIDWLLTSITLTDGQTVPTAPQPKARTTKTNVQPSTDIKYITHDAELRNILNLLPEHYLTNYDKWLLVLTAFKRLDKWELFDEWSRKCPAK